jgi:hypothetical protein
MRSGRMGPMGNDTRGREKWRANGKGPVMGKDCDQAPMA